MEIRQLKYFAAVVEEKTVIAAAEKLHMTQPPLTLQLHRLEEELGCRLFKRQGRGLVLTDAGQTMYQRAVEILSMCDGAKNEMADYRKGAVGTLRIGVISSVQGTLFLDWLTDYRAQHPKITVSIHGANTYQLLEKLQNREIDLAVVRTPFSAAGLFVRRLYREPMLAVGKAEFFKGLSAGPVRLGQLSGCPIILYRRWQKIIASCFEAEGCTPSLCCVNDDARMTLALTARGLGVGLLHPSALTLPEPASLKTVEIANRTLCSEIALICREHEQLPEPARLFWAQAEAAVRLTPYKDDKLKFAEKTPL